MNLEPPLSPQWAADELSGGGGVVGRPDGSPMVVLTRVLGASAGVLEEGGGIDLPDDELHREILLPLLPAMLRDKAIQQHWREQAATGFLARVQAYLAGAESMPQWQPGDFEIHVTASYLAGPDAKALADTLLSEESLRELTADLLNQVLAVVWPTLPVIEAVETVSAVVAPISLAPAPPAEAVSIETKDADTADPAAVPITLADREQITPSATSPAAARVPLKSSFAIARQLAHLPHPHVPKEMVGVLRLHSFLTRPPFPAARRKGDAKLRPWMQTRKSDR